MTAFLYAVRCRFVRPDLEAAWNEWYSGPKLRQMLRKPMFLSGQRFATPPLDTRRNYLCLWVVSSPEAFTTPEYRADWGFSEWMPHIADWSRDLCRSPVGAEDPLFEVGVGEALHVASFDGLGANAAQRLKALVEPRLPGMAWFEAAGLDRSSPFLGLRKLAPGARPEPLADAAGLGETVFLPITPRGRPEAGS